MVENLERRALRFLNIDYVISYDHFLEKSGKKAINVRNYRTLCREIFKTLNNLIPSFMSGIFWLRLTNCQPRDKYKQNMKVPKNNQIKFEITSLRGFGSKMWNCLSHHIKLDVKLSMLKRVIKKLNGVQCECAVCTNNLE